ncbi:hypothetical protein AAKU52_003083 [Pedobacter sp. CG_S7]|uniref:hypothetical protein n=1 Tax=Pedobacter sp. CG_S7 TaxID=3143930 RepID=UPI003392D3A2
MIRIYASNSLLLLEYTVEAGPDWVKEKLREDGELTLKRTFSFEAKDLLDETDRELVQKDFENQRSTGEDEKSDDPFEQEGEAVSFILGKLVADYYQIDYSTPYC